MEKSESRFYAANAQRWSFAFNQHMSKDFQTDNHPSVKETKNVFKNQFAGRTIGVFTSGGDSQGMNSALRAIVRMGIYLGCRVYLIHEGYQGMVDGKDNFQQANWATVSGIVGLGGTIIGSARCAEFRERPGRLKAAKNLVDFGINNLVCIGGDGTLTGAHIFRKEWPSLLDELLKKKEISEQQKEEFTFLNIVGVVGSIDNDYCGTDMTIGVDTALHRIIEAVDCITTTALSHQRCFVLEVMGRHCGYLALAAGLASEADWVFIPENPPETNWEDNLCQKLTYHREAGHRLNIVIVSEGAVDKEGNHISSEYVKSVIENRLKIDTRVTILGHVQRGGTTSAFDRVLGARLGSEAVLALMMAKSDTAPVVMGINGNQTCYIPLIESVERTQIVSQTIQQKNFRSAILLRGSSFGRNLETYIKMSKLEPKLTCTACNYTLAVLNIGAPACGVNSAIRSFVRHGVSRGCKILGVQDGFEGLVKNQVKQLKWKDVYGWTGTGGSNLGCQRVDAQSVGFEQIAQKIKELKIDGLFLIGGFEAFSSLLQLTEQRAVHNEFCIPMICLPATISNNVPGTDFSIGCDTALNEIVSICDMIKQSAMGSKRRVFLIETMGGYCGYLASTAGLASGSDASYIFEENFTITDLIDDIRHLRNKMQGDLKRGLLIRNEMANRNYTSEFIRNLLSEEGKGVFSARLNVLGHLQQGGVPTPFDRNQAIKFGARSLNHMVDMLDAVEEDGKSFDVQSRDSALVIGIKRNEIKFTSVLDLKEETDFEHRLPKKQWWLKLRPLSRILGKHEAIFTSEISEMNGFLEDKDENYESIKYLSFY